MPRLAIALLLSMLLALPALPSAAADEPPLEFSFILELPTIFEGICIGGKVNGELERVRCEVRAADSVVWPQNIYFLVVFGQDGTVAAIEAFRVEAETTLYRFPEK